MSVATYRPAAQDPEVVLARWWGEVRKDPRVAELAALVPQDRKLTLLDALPLAPLVWQRLATPADQLALLAVAAEAYAAATGLQIGPWEE